MTGKPLPSPSLLRQLLRYEPETGKLFWRTRDRNLTGVEAGGVDARNGYRRVRVGGRLELAHRVIIAMTSGSWPADQVDHINRKRDDNRIVNLREVSRSENLQNKSLYKNNKSGCAGVIWHKQHSKWYAAISVSKKQKFLGLFTKLDDAIAARKLAEKENGFHPNHGRKI